MTEEKITWDQTTQEKFERLLKHIPELIRGIAEARISRKAESLVRGQGRKEISEKDMVDAFFVETPSGFLAPMKSSMAELGIDYTKYGYDK